MSYKRVYKIVKLKKTLKKRSFILGFFWDLSSELRSSEADGLMG